MVGLGVPGHYITNLNDALLFFREILQKLPYIRIVWFPSKGKLHDPWKSSIEMFETKKTRTTRTVDGSEIPNNHLGWC